VAGWASVNDQKGLPAWDVVATHLRSGKRADGHDTDVTLKGVDDNPGLSNQG
jgi:S-sulfosulfanyl-L-cysteine sulfohydrolase